MSSLSRLFQELTNILMRSDWFREAFRPERIFSSCCVLSLQWVRPLMKWANSRKRLIAIYRLKPFCRPPRILALLPVLCWDWQEHITFLVNISSLWTRLENLPALFLSFKGDLAKAEEKLQAVPRNSVGVSLVSKLYLRLGNLEKAKEFLKQGLQQSRQQEQIDYSVWLGALADFYTDCGMEKKATKILNQFKKMTSLDAPPSVSRARCPSPFIFVVKLTNCISVLHNLSIYVCVSAEDR